LEKGIWANMAPIGYLNKRISDKDTKLVVDKGKAKYIKKAFELYAKGNISIKEIANILFSEGFRSRAGYKYHKSKLHKILSNPFYYGVMFMHGQYYAGKHKPIISKKLFDNVQKVLEGKHHSKRQKHFFAFRGFLYCENCGCLLTASKKKGHDYYYCTNGKGICDQHKRYLRQEEVEKLLAETFGELEFNPEMVEIMYLAGKEINQNKKSYKQEVIETLQNELNLVITKRGRLLDGYCSGIVKKDAYTQKDSLLQKQEVDLKMQIAKIEKKMQKEESTLEQTKKVFLQACYTKKEFLLAQEEEKRKTLQNLLWNVSIQNQKLAKVSFKPEFQPIANEPNLDDFDKLRRVRDLNPRGLLHPARFPSECTRPLCELSVFSKGKGGQASLEKRLTRFGNPDKHCLSTTHYLLLTNLICSPNQTGFSFFVNITTIYRDSNFFLS
jgi:site-specific DNA recombinase